MYTGLDLKIKNYTSHRENAAPKFPTYCSTTLENEAHKMLGLKFPLTQTKSPFSKNLVP